MSTPLEIFLQKNNDLFLLRCSISRAKSYLNSPSSITDTKGRKRVHKKMKEWRRLEERLVFDIEKIRPSI